MDDNITHIITLLITGAFLGMIYLSKKAQYIVKKKENLSSQNEDIGQVANTKNNISLDNTLEIQARDNISSTSEITNSSNWLSNFLMEHTSICDILAQQWFLNTCKIGFLCGTLCLVYGAVKSIPNFRTGQPPIPIPNNILNANPRVENVRPIVQEIAPNRFLIKLMKKQYKNAVFMTLYREAIKQRKILQLVKMLRNPALLNNISEQIIELSLITGIRIVKINNNSCSVVIPIPKNTR